MSWTADLNQVSDAEQVSKSIEWFRADSVRVDLIGDLDEWIHHAHVIVRSVVGDQ